MSFFRAKRYLRSRLDSVKIPARVPFVVDDKLVERQETAARELGPNSIRRILVTDHPEPVKPRIDIPEHFPIG